jgi:hypothetical protein
MQVEGRGGVFTKRSLRAAGALAPREGWDEGESSRRSAVGEEACGGL